MKLNHKWWDEHTAQAPNLQSRLNIEAMHTKLPSTVSSPLSAAVSWALSRTGYYCGTVACVACCALLLLLLLWLFDFLLSAAPSAVATVQPRCRVHHRRPPNEELRVAERGRSQIKQTNETMARTTTRASRQRQQRRPRQLRRRLQVTIHRASTSKLRQWSIHGAFVSATVLAVPQLEYAAGGELTLWW